ncbi:MAG TPA: hypothetical protein VNY05_01220 [Candidatus Acidoferrales bacterium]|jgi:hypothetical protein|nr:hypothetical protein [Candidatus Acidoferrales bacterium]
MSIGVEQPETLPPALPEQCEEVYSASSMPLNPNDRLEVQTIIAASRPSLWERVKESLPVLVVMVGTTFIVHSYIPAVIGSQTSGITSDIATLKADTGTLKESVGTVKTDVADLRKDIKEQLTKALDNARQELQKGKASGGPRGALRFGDEVLKIAELLNVRFEDEPLSRYGNALISVAFAPGPTNDIAQRSTTALLGYRSHLNGPLAPSLNGALPTTVKLARVPMVLSPEPNSNRDYRYVVVGDSVNPPPGLSWLGFFIDEPYRNWAPPDVLPEIQTLGSLSEHGAVIESLDPSLKIKLQQPSIARYAKYIVVSAKPGTTISLDYTRFRNVIFVNSSIAYKGRPVDLEGVYFVNCVFSIVKDSKSMLFAIELMNPGATRFKS